MNHISKSYFLKAREWMKKAKYRQIYKIDHFTFTFAMCCLSQRQLHTASIRQRQRITKGSMVGFLFGHFGRGRAEIFLEESQSPLLCGFYLTFIWLFFLSFKAWADWSALACKGLNSPFPPRRCLKRYFSKTLFESEKVKRPMFWKS